MEARTIDWEGIHRRLAVVAAAISGDLNRSPEETRRILQARARAAAKSPRKAAEAEQLEILAFTLAGEIYGIETRYVREVCQLKELTPVPCTPSFIAGMMNVRGQILAVMDLRSLLELPRKGLTELNRVVVLKEGDDELGLLADSIDGMRSLPLAELQERLTTLTGIRDRFLKGVTGQMLAVLDGRRLLADADLKVNEQVD